MSKQICKVECNDRGEVIRVTVLEEVVKSKKKGKGKEASEDDEEVK